MTTDQLPWTTGTLFLVAILGCASPQPKATTRADKPAVVQALDGLCREVRAIAGDPGICPQDRRSAVQGNPECKKIAASEAGKQIQKAMATAVKKQRYAALVALADQAGQPGWSCAELGRFIDEDPDFIRPKHDGKFLSDLDEYCRIVDKNNREQADVVLRTQAINQEAQQRLGCAMREMLAALKGVGGATRYSIMQQTAAESGKADWECAALEPGESGRR